MGFRNVTDSQPQINPYPYRSYVAAQSRSSPCLKNLSRFLSDDTFLRNNCRIVCLEFSAVSDTPSHTSLDEKNLASLLYKDTHGDDSLRGRILVVEDLTRDIVELLGSALNIDPFFFASHVDVFQPDIAIPRPYMATLPSMASAQSSLFLHYHRALEFEKAVSKRNFFQDMNIPRKVILLPPHNGVNIALARNCCSVMKTVGKDGCWLGLVLVDPSSSRFCVSGRQDDDKSLPFMLQSQPFQGGFESFLSRPAFQDTVISEPGLGRRSLIEDLVFYWCNGQPQGFDVNAPTLISMSQYPLRVIAAEWMIYSQVMYHSIKQYEFNPGTISAALEQITILYTDLSSLQKWARRSMATSRELRYVIDFLESNTVNGEDLELTTLLIKDYKHIASSVDLYSCRLDAMVPIVTSLIQIIDSRRSLIETANISRLTHLALVFVPLMFVSGLFSMNDRIAPGGKLFWLHIAVAIPMSLIVFLLARLSTINPSSLAVAVWNSKGMKLFRG